MDYLIFIIGRYKYTISIVIVSLCLFVYYIVDPVQYSIMPKCPVKLITHLDCPGCGFQRALHASLHGRFDEAIHYNLFLLLAIPITCLWILNKVLISKTENQRRIIKLIWLNKMIIYFYIFSYFCWFIIRNI